MFEGIFTAYYLTPGLAAFIVAFLLVFLLRIRSGKKSYESFFIAAMIALVCAFIAPFIYIPIVTTIDEHQINVFNTKENDFFQKSLKNYYPISLSYDPSNLKTPFTIEFHVPQKDYYNVIVFGYQSDRIVAVYSPRKLDALEEGINKIYVPLTGDEKLIGSTSFDFDISVTRDNGDKFPPDDRWPDWVNEVTDHEGAVYRSKEAETNKFEACSTLTIACTSSEILRYVPSVPFN